jgi:hypothetical protein
MDILRTSTPIAKKDHKCNYCGFLIPKGEKYIYTPIKGDHFFVWKSHLKCQRLAEELDMFDGCDEGVTENDFYEFINEEYHSRWLDEENGLKTWKERFDFVSQIILESNK